MPEQYYEYTISTAFPNGTVNSDSLKEEIAASGILTALVKIVTRGAYDACDIYFADILSAEDKTTLDGVVAAHQGDPPTQVVFKAPSNLLMDAKSVTEDQDWETMGGTVTTVASFVPDVNKAWGRLIGQCKVAGAGAQVRLIRQSNGAVCGGPFDVGDSGGEWEYLQQWATQNQPPGIECFLLQARLNGATSMEMQYFLVSLFQKYP
jgi:hypothetical protein